MFTIRASEALAEDRIANLAAVLLNINEVQSRASGDTAKTLDSAQERVQEFMNRYQDEIQRIAVVRWQNKIAPLAENWSAGSFQALSRRLLQLDELVTDAEALKVKSCDGNTPKACELIVGCLETTQALREAMVAVQARLAIQPLQEIAKGQPVEADVREIDLFNARQIVDDFSQSFTELEAEFAKVDYMTDVEAG